MSNHHTLYHHHVRQHRMRPYVSVSRALYRLSENFYTGVMFWHGSLMKLATNVDLAAGWTEFGYSFVRDIKLSY